MDAAIIESGAYHPQSQCLSHLCMYSTYLQTHSATPFPNVESIAGGRAVTRLTAASPQSHHNVKSDQPAQMSDVYIPLISCFYGSSLWSLILQAGSYNLSLSHAISSCEFHRSSNVRRKEGAITYSIALFRLLFFSPARLQNRLWCV